MNNPLIIRNQRKIKAAICNAQKFIDIQQSWGSFSEYIWHFTNHEIVYPTDHHLTHNDLSDTISKDLKKKGMSFVGTVTIYSFLQAIGIINDHEEECFLGGKKDV